ncbi:MAG: hypothetical protein HY423_03125 [Candidatus Lambdaproteobacteria bacterium]|nr:hypothetical protein [Candidatus Lambdaproteobacteria bacterium]
MIIGKISKLDVVSRTAVIRTEGGEEYSISVPEAASIAVCEPCTMGTKGGELGELEVGYWVRASIGEICSDGTRTCTTLESIS